MDLSIWIVFIGTALIGISAALVGTFTFLQKKSLIGDAISHSILPGIVLAYMISGERNTLNLMLGAFVAGWLATQQISWLQRKTKLKSDTIVAATLSIFFAVGLALLSYIQGRPDDGQAGLSDFLFGKASALLSKDVLVYLYVLLIVLSIIGLTFRSLKIYLFDKTFASTIGLPINFLQSILTFCIILITAIGVQTVGVVLMSALLVSPATSALLWQNKLQLVLLWAAIFSSISTLLGVVISFIFPFFPTGPSIVIVLSVIAFLSIILSKKKFFKKKSNKGYSFYQN